jgi:hypothetical protein
MAMKWYEFESTQWNKITFYRMHFRNLNGIKEKIDFPFEITKKNDLYKEPFDSYTLKNTGAEIIVMVSDAHCHVGTGLGKYQEAIAFFCDEKDREEIVKQIEKII